jgi:hypothetical protein
MSTLPDFLQPLEFLSDPLPREALATAIARRDESVPHLLNALQWAHDNPDEANDSDRPYMLHIFALFLLAQFRESRACELVVRLARHPDVDALIGDMVGEDLHAILASVCGGETRLIEELIEDDNANEWVRSAAVRSLGTLICAQIRSREEISAYFGALLTERLTREPSFVWDAIVAVCVDLCMAEHLEPIRKAYAEGLADPWVDRLEDVERLIVDPGATRGENVGRDRYTLIDDAIAEMEDWDCFQPDAGHHDDGFDDNDEDEPGVPIVRDTPKVGRNDPCPCGSGKKFKKCCGNLAGKI